MKNVLWDRVALLGGVILAFVLMWWAVSTYFGDEGVRFTMLGTATLILFVAVFTMYTIAMRQVMSVHNATINGIVDFQAADDRGEVARARVLQEVVRSDRDYAKEVGRLAARFGQDQAKAITDANKQPLALPERSSFNPDAWGSVPVVQFADYDIAD